MVDLFYYVPSKPNGENGYIDDNTSEIYPTNPHDLKWCQYCAHYGYISRYNACADGSWFKILRKGPLAVSFCGYCKHFVNKYSPKGQAIQYSKFKQKLLAGMGFQQKREK